MSEERDRGVSGSGPIEESQAEGSPEPVVEKATMDHHAAAEALYERYSAGFMAWQLRDGGQFLVNPSRVGTAVGAHLSPIQSRHEQMVRALCAMVSSLVIRVRVLERDLLLRAHGEVSSVGPDPSLQAEGEISTVPARWAASPGRDESAGESESGGLVRAPAESPVVESR